MGNAAYNRGSKLISRQIRRDAPPKTDLRTHDYNKGLSVARAESIHEIERLRRQIETLRATLTVERHRYRVAVSGVQRLRDEYLNRGASQAARVAIVALNRVVNADPGVGEEEGR